MILISDATDLLGTDPKIAYYRLKHRAEVLDKILFDENESFERRKLAYDKKMVHEGDLENIKTLLEVPFDVLIVIENAKDFVVGDVKEK